MQEITLIQLIVSTNSTVFQPLLHSENGCMVANFLCLILTCNPSLRMLIVLLFYQALHNISHACLSPSLHPLHLHYQSPPCRIGHIHSLHFSVQLFSVFHQNSAQSQMVISSKSYPKTFSVHAQIIRMLPVTQNSEIPCTMP